MEDANPDNHLANLMKEARLLWASDAAKKQFGIESIPNLLDIKGALPRPISEIIDASIQILLETFGAELLTTLASKITELSQYAFGGFRGHPLGIIWHQLMQAKYLILRKQQPIISKDLCIGIALCDYLDSIYEANNFNRLTKDLSNIKEPEKFYKAFFEAHIASGFVSLGYRCTFLEEGNTKTPDLEFRMDDKKIVVECKSLDPPTHDRGEIYHGLVKRIVQNADRKQKCYAIHIQPMAKLNSSDIKPISKFINNLLEEDEEGMFYDSSGTTRIVLKQLAKGYSENLNELRIDFDTEEDSYVQVKFENTENGFFAPIYVGMLDRQKKPLLQTLENSFNAARKQFKNYEDCTSLIAIEIFAYSAIELSAKLDMCDFFMRQKLKNNSSIGGVIISAFLFYKNDIEWPFQQYSSLVINNNARNPVSGENIYGLEPILSMELGDGFTVPIHCHNETLMRNNEKLLGLASFCERQMKVRTRFFFVSNSFFKLEFVDSGSNKFVYKKLFQVPPDETWTCAVAAIDRIKNEASLYVNGKPAEFMYVSDDYGSSELEEAERKSLFISEIHRVIDDAQQLGYQCQPYLISQNPDHSFYCPDLDKRKKKLERILSSIEGLVARTERAEEIGALIEHKRLTIEYLDNIKSLVSINVEVAKELLAIDNYQEYNNRGFWREATIYGQNIFVLLNKLIADERYYILEIGSLFWGPN